MLTELKKIGVSGRLILMCLFYMFFQLIPSSSQGQSVKLSDLVFLINCDKNQFDTYATTLGYSYYKHMKNNSFESWVYSGKRFGETSTAFLTSDVLKFNSRKEITYQTIVQSDYLAIKKELVKDGFKYNGAGPAPNGAYGLSYSKGTLEVDLISFNSEKNSTGYLIKISQPL